MEEISEHKKSRLRSPNYPAFTLEESISKIKILWDKDGKAGAHRSVVLKHLGFNSESGSALRNLSTLKMFNLTAETNRHIVLTENALDIMLYSHDQSVYYRALQECALNPVIYNQIYNKYIDGLPSVDALKSELIREHDFNPKVLDRFITDFKSTLEYAGLLDGKNKIERISTEKQKDTSEMRNVSTHRPPYNEPICQDTAKTNIEHSFPIPLLKGNKATITFAKRPVQKSDLDKIKQWIDLFGESLIENENPEN